MSGHLLSPTPGVQLLQLLQAGACNRAKQREATGLGERGWGRGRDAGVKREKAGDARGEREGRQGMTLKQVKDKRERLEVHIRERHTAAGVQGKVGPFSEPGKEKGNRERGKEDREREPENRDSDSSAESETKRERVKNRDGENQ